LTPPIQKTSVRLVQIGLGAETIRKERAQFLFTLTGFPTPNPIQLLNFATLSDPSPGFKTAAPHPCAENQGPEGRDDEEKTKRKTATTCCKK
jgi:hypothetical protein